MAASTGLIATVVATSAVFGAVGCSRPATSARVDAAESPAPPSSSVAISSSQSASSSSVAAQASGWAAGLDVTLTADDSAPLRPGGDPMGFTVTRTNTTPADIAGVGLVVAMGHCSCTPSGARMMPSGSMTMLDPGTKAWVSAPYVREGTGTDYLGQTVVPPFVLKQGATEVYQFQVRLSPSPEITAGDGSVSVTLTTPSGSGTAATIPVTVAP